MYKSQSHSKSFSWKHIGNLHDHERCIIYNNWLNKNINPTQKKNPGTMYITVLQTEAKASK